MARLIVLGFAILLAVCSIALGILGYYLKDSTFIGSGFMAILSSGTLFIFERRMNTGSA